MAAASQDTTAVSLAWTMHFLAKHPEVQEKARREAGPCHDACPRAMQGLVELLACVLPDSFLEARRYYRDTRLRHIEKYT